MKSFKKLLSLVLALVMCICLAVPVSAAESEFPDVENGTWYTNAVERWADAELIMGYPNGDFGTNDPITRGQVAVIVSRLLGVEESGDASFADVTDESAYYYDAVLACANAGIINGYPDGSFGPDEYISREAAFKIVMDALLTDAEVAAIDVSVLDQFADAGQVSDWAEGFVAAIVTYGAVNGRETSAGSILAPTENITRAEFATILNRLIAVYVDVNGVASVFEASDTKAETDITGAGFVVVHAENDNLQVSYEIKNEQTVVIIVKTEEGQVVAKEEFSISSEADDIVLVHGQTDSINKDVMEEGEVKDMVHTFDPCTNCAVTQTIKEYCEVCGTVEHIEAAHPHTFNEDGICECCKMTEADAMKFNLTVSSNGNSVEANVTNDYAATLTVTPGKVSAAEVTISATMQDVASLGGGTRHHEDTFTTNMTGDPSLSTWLSNVFTFESGDIVVSGLLEDEVIGYELKGTPQVKGDDGYYPEAAVITATPYDVEDTRDAWAELTSHVTTSDQTESDSYVNIANGSYMIVGDDKLCFEKGLEEDDKDLKLDNFSDLDAMEKEIRSKVQLITNSAFESDDYEAKFYLAAGTELAVSNSIATLDDNCTITVSGEGLNSKDFQDVLTNIRDAESTYDMATELVNMINAMVGSADGETIYVDFEFTAPVEKDSKFYLGMTANNADGNGTTTVDMEVYDDYSLEINLPMNKLSAQEVKLDVSMTDVASLGTAGTTKSHTQTINTGMTATGDLNTWMSNAKTFETATINATIIGVDGATEACTYVLESDMDADWVTITGTTKTQDAREAWALMMKYVEDRANEKGDDSYIEIAKNSHLIIGSEILKFETGVDNLVLDNFSNIAAIKENIKAHVMLDTMEESTLEAFVGAGTKLAVSSSVAELTKNALIEVSVTDEDGNAVDFSDSTALSELRSDSSSNEELVKDLFNLLNEMVYKVNNATVDVTITFFETVEAE